MQGKLRNEPLSFEITTECACCSREIQFRMHSDLSYELPEALRPMFFVPLVDFTRLRAKSIIDRF